MKTTLSAVGQQNLDWLLELLQLRLRSNGKMKTTDSFGNTVFVDSDIYSREMLESFIHLSISNFNEMPDFTFFTVEDTKVMDVFKDIIIEGAMLHALASQALIERGREFVMSDRGISLTPPSISDLLNTQFTTLFQFHLEKLKIIKSRISDFKK